MRNSVDRRRTVIVDPALQTRLVLRSTLSLVLAALVGTFLLSGLPLLYGWWSGDLDWGRAEARHRLAIVLREALLPILAGALFFFARGVRELGRVAGPSVRVTRTLRDLASGDIARGFETRRGDYLKDTARELDHALWGLTCWRRDLEISTRALEESLGRLLADEEEPELLRAKSAASRLREVLDQYRTSEQLGGNRIEAPPEAAKSEADPPKQTV